MSQEYVLELQKLVPELALWGVPYLFESDKHVENYINSRPARSILEKFDQHGFLALEYTFSGGFIHFYGERMNDFSEIANANFNLEPSSKPYQQLFEKNLKAKISSKQLVVSEIIAAVGEDLISESKKRKIFLNMTDHRVISRVLLMNKSFFDKLPLDFQKVVLEESHKMATVERKLSVDGKHSFLKIAEAHNIQLNPWSEEAL